MGESGDAEAIVGAMCWFVMVEVELERLSSDEPEEIPDMERKCFSRAAGTRGARTLSNLQLAKLWEVQGSVEVRSYQQQQGLVGGGG